MRDPINVKSCCPWHGMPFRRVDPSRNLRAASFTIGTLLLLLGPAGASAQTITGRILDGGTDAVLPDARVQALSPGGEEVGTAVLSGPDGAFVLQLPEPGSYYLRVEKLSYREIFDGEFVFDERGSQLSMDIYLLPDPVVLDGVDVSVDLTPIRRSLRNQGFYQRVAEGFGDFVSPEEIEARLVNSVTDYMRSIPGVRVHGGILKFKQPSVRGPDGLCEPNVFVDGVLVLSDWHAKYTSPEMRQVNDMVHPTDVAAIEIYRRVSSTPLQWIEPNASCGTVVIWTKTGG